jgi:DNA-binding transcriptional MerR regulator
MTTTARSEPVTEAATLLIGDVARSSGLSIDTLRYYDRAGLLGEVRRNAAGRRVFDHAALGLLDVVSRLRRTGMPVDEVRRFVDLVRFGDAERAGRLDLLRAHRERVGEQLTQLHEDLAVIDWKIAAYEAGEEGREAPPPPSGWPRPTAVLPTPDLRPGSSTTEPAEEAS